MRRYGKLRHVSNNTMITPVVVSVSISPRCSSPSAFPSAAISPLSFAVLASIPPFLVAAAVVVVAPCLSFSHQDNPVGNGVARASAFSVTRKSIRSRASRSLNFTRFTFRSMFRPQPVRLANRPSPTTLARFCRFWGLQGIFSAKI